MANHSSLVNLALVGFDKLRSAREGYLVDELVDFFCRHSDTSVADGNGLFLFVDIHMNTEVAQFSAEFTQIAEGF